MIDHRSFEDCGLPYHRIGALSAPVSSRQFLHLVERVAAIGTWAWEPETGAMIWSDSLHRLMRKDPATYKPRMDDIIAMAHPDDRWIIEEKLRPGADFEAMPARMIFPDGSIRWHLCHKEIVPGSGDRVRLVIGVVQDVTETWTSQALLLQRQRLFDTLVRLVGGIMWRADTEGTLTFANGWCDFTATTMAQNAGSGWLSVLHPADRVGALAAWRNAIEARTLYATSYRVRRYDGVYVPMEAKASPLLDSAGKLVEWVGYCAPMRDALRPPAPQPLEGKGSGPAPNELRAARALLGLSVDDLAKASGVSVATITRYETGNEAVAIRPVNKSKLLSALANYGVQFSVEDDGSRTIRLCKGGE